MSSHMNDQEVRILAQDWANREFIQNVQYSIMQIASFLNKFDSDVRGKIANLNHKLIRLEEQVTYLETFTGGVADRVAQADQEQEQE